MRLPEHRDYSRHLMEGANMNLIPLGDIELHYTSLTSLDYGSGGQNYGTMEGWLRGESVSGELRLTNFAPRRPDNVNLPNLRGLLTTEDGAIIAVEMNGIATLREADRARVFVTSLTFRTGDARYAWLDTVFGLLEGVLDTATLVAQGRAYRCDPTFVAAF
jgi:Protein of unknown function (DUF3237)